MPGVPNRRPRRRSAATRPPRRDQPAVLTSIFVECPLIFTGTAALTGWALESEVNTDVRFMIKSGWFPWWPILLWCLLAIGAAACFVMCVIRCHQCISPRTPDGDAYVPNPLFPFHDPEKPEQLDALHRRYDDLHDSQSRETAMQRVIDDYKDQAKQLGRILFEKIKAVRRTVLWLFGQIYFTMGYVFLLLVMRGFAGLQ